MARWAAAAESESARLPSSAASHGWLVREWLGTEPGWVPSVVLPLANDRGVRRAIVLRGGPVLLHAATSKDWTAELHRHVVSIDDCIVSRILYDSPPPAFVCSSGEVAAIDGTGTVPRFRSSRQRQD